MSSTTSKTENNEFEAFDADAAFEARIDPMAKVRELQRKKRYREKEPL